MSFTVDEEQFIEALVPQFRLDDRLVNENTAVTLAIPQFIVSIPAAPIPPYTPTLEAAAPTGAVAIADIESQLDTRIAAARDAIDAWIAGLNNHHRYFELYREACMRAIARLRS